MNIPGTEVEGVVAEGWQRTPIDWMTIMAWCRAHPGRTREVTGVYSTAPWSLRRRYPDMTVTSGNHHHEDGRRVCDVRVVYEP